PPPLSATATDTAISPALASVVQRCLEKDRGERFQSARDLAFALRSLVGTSGSGTLSPVTEQPRRRTRWLVAAGVTLAVLLAFSGAPYFGRPSVPSHPSFKPLTFRRGHVAVARFAPDEQTVISSASWDGKPWELASTRLDTAEPSRLPLENTGLFSISSSGEL